MTDRAGDSLIVQGREGGFLLYGFVCERSRKKRDRRVAGFAVPGRFYSPRVQQYVHAFAIKRFAGGISVQRLGPGCVSIVMAPGAPGGRKEIRFRDAATVRGPGVGWRELRLRIGIDTQAFRLVIIAFSRAVLPA